MREPITVGGHLRIRPFNTADSYPEQRLDNDLCQAVVAGHTVYLRGQVPQDLDTGENVHTGDPAGQAEQVMTNVETLLAEAGASIEHVVSCTVYLTDIRHREAVYWVLGRRLARERPAQAHGHDGQLRLHLILGIGEDAQPGQLLDPREAIADAVLVDVQAKRRGADAADPQLRGFLQRLGPRQFRRQRDL